MYQPDDLGAELAESVFQDAHPWPGRLDRLPPCRHCRGQRWQQRPADGRWLCACYFDRTLVPRRRSALREAQV